MYNLIQRAIGKLYYDNFAALNIPEFNLLPLDLMRIQDNANKFFILDVTKLDGSPLFAIPKKLSVYDYRYPKYFYEMKFTKTSHFTKDMIADALRVIEQDRVDIFENYSVISLDFVESLRQEVYSELDKNKIQPFSQETKDMIFYTLLLGLYPELFMRTPLQIFSIDFGLSRQFKEALDAKSSVLVSAPKPVIDTFRFTAESLGIKYTQPQFYDYNTVQFKYLFAYAHGIYRYHLAIILLMNILNPGLSEIVENGLQILIPFRKYVMKNLVGKYKFMLESVVSNGYASYNDVQKLILTDIIDYLQLLGITLGFIYTLPERMDYKINKKKQDKLLDKVIVNLERVKHTITSCDKIDEFVREYIIQLHKADAYLWDDEKLGMYRRAIGTIHGTTRTFAFHCMQHGVSLPLEHETDYFKDFDFPREYLDMYVKRFEKHIAYSFNMFYNEYVEKPHLLLPEKAYQNASVYGKVYLTTHPMLTMYGVVLTDIIKNGIMRYNGVFDKYKDLENDLIGRGEHVFGILQTKIAEHMGYKPNNYMPEEYTFYASQNFQSLVDYIRIITRTGLDKISDTSKTIFSDLISIITRPEFDAYDSNVIDYDQNIIETKYDYAFLNPYASGYIQSAIPQLLQERQAIIEQEMKKRKQQSNESVGNEDKVKQVDEIGINQVQESNTKQEEKIEVILVSETVEEIEEVVSENEDSEKVINDVEETTEETVSEVSVAEDKIIEVNQDSKENEQIIVDEEKEEECGIVNTNIQANTTSQVNGQSTVTVMQLESNNFITNEYVRRMIEVMEKIESKLDKLDKLDIVAEKLDNLINAVGYLGGNLMRANERIEKKIDTLAENVNNISQNITNLSENITNLITEQNSKIIEIINVASNTIIENSKQLVEAIRETNNQVAIAITKLQNTLQSLRSLDNVTGSNISQTQINKSDVTTKQIEKATDKSTNEDKKIIVKNSQIDNVIIPQDEIDVPVVFEKCVIETFTISKKKNIDNDKQVYDSNNVTNKKENDIEEKKEEIIPTSPLIEQTEQTISSLTPYSITSAVMEATVENNNSDNFNNFDEKLNYNSVDNLQDVSITQGNSLDYGFEYQQVDPLLSNLGDVLLNNLDVGLSKTMEHITNYDENETVDGDSNSQGNNDFGLFSL